MRTTHLLYLHGFRSSPASAKARQMAAYAAQQHPALHFCCPQLPPSPRAAMQAVAQSTADWPRGAMAVVGSSLGGFYASWLAQQSRCPSVLLNPAVDPARDLRRHIGTLSHWHQPGERFDFLPEYIGELEALDLRGQPPAAPELLIAARGDEVLDWREMLARYPQARQIVLEGGNHALSDFGTYLPTIAQFLQLA